MERRLTTIVAADLVGYSRLMAADEEGTVERFRKVRAELIQPELAAAKARLIKTMGDGLLVEFPSPVAAVRASLAIQKSMVERERDQDKANRLQFRIGINLGDVIIDGDDILGDGVNVAARLESLAPPGGICISRAIHEQLRGKIDATLTALGPQDVKNMPEPVEVWRVEIDGLKAAPTRQKPAVAPSIVILPFDNMSSDPEQGFLADGIVEDVTTELSKFRTLTVIARNSAFTYKGTPKDVREIARELDVKYVVEGSVRRSGNRLRVTAQLIEAETGGHLWAERWDRTMADLFDVQDELTSAIVTGVEPELGAHERILSRKKPTEHLTAWELAQRGNSRLYENTSQSCDIALDLYNQAMRIDPEFAFVHALSSRIHFARLLYGWSEDFDQDLREGMRLADQAVDLDPKSDYGHVMRGTFLAMCGRHGDAKDAFDVAERLNPNFAMLCSVRGFAETFKTEPDPDVMEADALKALRLSPNDPQANIFHNLFGVAQFIRNSSKHNEASLKAFELTCRYPNVSGLLLVNAAMVCVDLDRLDDAAHYLERAMNKAPELTVAFITKAWDFYPQYKKYLAENMRLMEKLVEFGLPEQ